MTVTDANAGRRADAALQQRLAPSRLGQATAVEQSRAIAEVQAAIVVAQQCPRDITRAERAMRQSCGQKSLAERAFYRYPRGKDDNGKTIYISGPSVQLARELARCFGNVQYGVAELLRDDSYGQSEMLAFAWDVETNTRASSTFINPHRRDTKKGVKVLTDMRDIYENNANNGARRLREMIFSILPAWFTEDATAACYETIAADDSGVPIGDRVARAIEGFASRKVTAAQLEQKLGAPSAKWSPHDLAQLSVIYRSIMRGEIRVEDEFPAAAQRVTAAEITGQQAAQDAGPAAEGPAPAAGPGPKPKGQPAPPAAVKRMEDLIAQLGLGPPEDVDDLIRWLCPGYAATRSEVQHVTGYLRDHLEQALKVQGGGGDEALAVAAKSIWDQYRTATGEREGGGDA
jgi:hypothetical protein